MIELKFGPRARRLRTADLSYMIRLYDVTEEMFDESVDEDTKAELIDGVMVVHSPASPRHDDVAGFLRSLMRFYVRRKKLGNVLGPDSLVHLATCRKFAADMYFLEQKRVPRPLPRKEFEGAPDLVAEVLSPSNREVDIEDKRPAYQQAGVKEIWLIDPDAEEIMVDRRRGKRYVTRCVSRGQIKSHVIPGFWIEAAWLWSDPLPEELECLLEILG
jgi:Uma2 family endonuclease